MSFKADTIKLKRYTSNPSGSEGVIALVGSSSGVASLKYYDGSWKDIDSNPSNSNTIKSDAWGDHITLAKNIDVESLVFYNITDSSSYTLKIPATENYGTQAQIHIINGSDKAMSLVKENTSIDPGFMWRASNNSAKVSTVELGAGQKALLLKTSTNYWEVVVLSL